MAKAQAKVYVEQDVWDRTLAIFEEQGISNTVGLERILKAFVEADHETRLMILQQAGSGNYAAAIARQTLARVTKAASGSLKDAARTDPGERHKPRRPKD